MVYTKTKYEINDRLMVTNWVNSTGFNKPENLLSERWNGNVLFIATDCM